MPKVTPLTRPLRRRIRELGLVVEIDSEGMTLRGFNRHNGRRYSWQQIASLTAEPAERNRAPTNLDPPTEVLRRSEQKAGAAELDRIRGNPT